MPRALGLLYDCDLALADVLCEDPETVKSVVMSVLERERLWLGVILRKDNGRCVAEVYGFRDEEPPGGLVEGPAPPAPGLLHASELDCDELVYRGLKESCKGLRYLERLLGELYVRAKEPSALVRLGELLGGGKG